MLLLLVCRFTYCLCCSLHPAQVVGLSVLQRYKVGRQPVERRYFFTELSIAVSYYNFCLETD